MQYFFGIWVSQGLHRCTCTAGDLQASGPDAHSLYVRKLGLLAAQHGLGQRSCCRWFQYWTSEAALEAGGDCSVDTAGAGRGSRLAVREEEKEPAEGARYVCPLTSMKGNQ